MTTDAVQHALDLAKRLDTATAIYWEAVAQVRDLSAQLRDTLLSISRSGSNLPLEVSTHLVALELHLDQIQAVLGDEGRPEAR